jgi:hypothetical protein
MSFQCPAYWDDSLQTGTIPFDMRRESAIFPGLSVIKQMTAETVVGGGTSTAGPWDGEPNNSGKNNESLEIEPCDFLIKCKICKIICKIIYIISKII